MFTGRLLSLIKLSSVTHGDSSLSSRVVVWADRFVSFLKPAEVRNEQWKGSFALARIKCIHRVIDAIFRHSLGSFKMYGKYFQKGVGYTFREPQSS